MSVAQRIGDERTRRLSSGLVEHTADWLRHSGEDKRHKGEQRGLPFHLVGGFGCGRS